MNVVWLAVAVKSVTVKDTPDEVLFAHEGMPEAKVNTWPFVPADNLANVFVADE